MTQVSKLMTPLKFDFNWKHLNSICKLSTDFFILCLFNEAHISYICSNQLIGEWLSRWSPLPKSSYSKKPKCWWKRRIPCSVSCPGPVLRLPPLHIPWMKPSRARHRPVKPATFPLSIDSRFPPPPPHFLPQISLKNCKHFSRFRYQKFCWDSFGFF